MIHFNSKLFEYLLPATLVVLFYGNTLFNGFVYDDSWQIQNNKFISSLANLPDAFSGCISEDNSGDCQNKGVYYRPLQTVSHILTRQISASPWAFHLVNLVYLYLVAVVILKLFSLLFSSRLLAVVGTILVVSHPVNSEVANWVSAVPELLLILFGLLFLIYFIHYSKGGQLKHLFLSAVFFLAALFAKETAVFLLVLPFLYEAIWGKCKSVTNYFEKRYLCLILFALPVIVYFSLRYIIMGNVVHQYQGVLSFDQSSHLATALVFYLKYLIKLIYPLPLNAQNVLQPIPLTDWRVIPSVLFIIANITILYLAWRGKEKVVLFGFSLFFLSLLPVLLFVNKIGGVIFSERYLFLPSVGMIMVIVSLFPRLVKILKRQRVDHWKKLSWILLGGYLLATWFIVFTRNQEWHDDLTYTKSVSAVSPGNYIAHYNLGVTYASQGELELAVVAFHRAIAAKPDFLEAHYNLGNAYQKLGKIDLAVAEYQQTLSIDPNFTAAKDALSLTVANPGGQESRWVEYQGKEGLSLRYPPEWKKTRLGSSLIFEDPQGEFTIKLAVDQKSSATSRDEYLLQQHQSFGKLVNQGLAQIPNVDFAYVKVWKEDSTQRMEFFLFQDDKVIKILVSPSDSPLMKVFDQIISSMKLTNN